MLSVIEHTRPGVLRFADDDCIGVTHGLLRKTRRMRSANDHRHASVSEFSRDAIGMKSGRRRRGDSHKVRRDIESNTVHDLIRMRNQMVRRSERCNQRHCELRELN
jgi:hypothetical protein